MVQIRAEKHRVQLENVEAEKAGLMRDLDDAKDQLLRARTSLQHSEYERENSAKVLTELNDALKDSLRETESQLEDARGREKELRAELRAVGAQLAEARSKGTDAMGHARQQTTEMEARVKAQERLHAEEVCMCL